MVAYLVLSAFAYIPFVIWPYFKEKTIWGAQMNVDKEQINWPLWILAFFHLLGSIGWSGSRALGDACAVNFAKRLGGTYSEHRVYGAYTFGILGYLMGFVNQNNPYFPDFVPAVLLYCFTMIISALLVHHWPDEYFKMSTVQRYALTENQRAIMFELERRKLPKGRELWKQIKGRISATFRCNNKDLSESETGTVVGSKQIMHKSNSNRAISTKKQLKVLALLCKRDYRIILSLIVIFHTGLSAYAAINFVFTYLDVYCKTRGTCSGAEISSLMIFGFSLIECLAYELLARIKLNCYVRLMMIFATGIIHFNFYGFLIENLSPYWFLIEALHGIEYSLTLTLLLDMGYKFAREVDLIIPELIDKGVISAHDREEQELTRVSLMATMSGLFTMVFDGISCSIGAVIFGQIVGHFSFKVLWICIGGSATIGLFLTLMAFGMSKLFDLRPRLLKADNDGKSDERDFEMS